MSSDVMLCDIIPFVHVFRNNFLKLDVYYGELKYESVQQQKGYNFLDYLGKVKILQLASTFQSNLRYT